MAASAFVFYLFAFVSCVGAGVPMWRMLLAAPESGEYSGGSPSLLEYAVAGLFAISVFATLVNFIIPVSQLFSSVLLTACFVAGVLKLRETLERLGRNAAILAPVAALFAYWAAKFVLS